MKRQFFNPACLDKNRLPNMVSRRIFGSSRHGGENVSYLTDAADEAEVEALMKKIEAGVAKQLAGRATKEDVKNISDQLLFLTRGKNEKGEEVDSPFPIETLRAMADEKTGVMAKLVKQGEELQRLRNEVTRSVEKLDVRSQVEKWAADNKEAIQAIRSGNKAELKPLDIRVASPMGVSTVNAGASTYIGRVEGESTPTEIVRAEPMFWDFLTKGRTNAPTYYWVNKTNPLGAAAFIAPGVAKPGISLELESETSNAKKIADSAKAQTELLEDIDGMTTFIEQELRYQVMIKVNEKLMSGTASSTSPAGIQSLSTAYTLTSVKTVNPNIFDCLRAVVAQLRSGWLKGEITIFINSVDAANMDLSKASDSGVYNIPPFTTADGKRIAGARVVEDNNVPAGYVQAGFLRFYRVLIYKDFYVTWGWENDDLTKNLVTVVGEMRLHQFFNTQYTGAFLYDSFENIKTAIREA